ncbi:MAG: NAD(P)H-binding protein [Pseudonocardia sp.]|nr:NAD(P)H-binding protein [Pseudonocardia sp.]
MITVLGATGNTGGRIVERLRAAGEPVRAVGRDAGRLARAAGLGAQPHVGDAGDPAFLRRAFENADAAYVLMPMDVMTSGYAAQQATVGESITEALRSSGVPYVVALSSLGAEVPGGPNLDATGFMGTLHEQEQRLATLDTNLVLLRPGLFLESFLHGVDAMRAHGTHADSIDPDVALPMVATRDVGDVAADLLRRRSWSGTVVREVLGAADLTVGEAVAVLGPALGMPGLSYVRIPDDEMEALLRGAGMPDDAARLHVAMNRAFNDGTVASLAGRGPGNTTPTTVEEWARTLSGALR